MNDDRGTTRGRVVEFDEATGLGTVESEQGAQYGFHCIEIADGSRTIAVGTTVEFRLIPKFGRYEAASIRTG